MDPSRATLRRARDDDAPEVIALIERVFAEYPGNVLDVETEERGLLAPASSYDDFWVVDCGGVIAGTSALVVHGSGRSSGEVKKVYVDRRLRGTGWGRRLLDTVEARAIERGLATLVAWSDTRFETAHRVYEALGYRATGRSRELHDLSRSTEIEFEKRLPPPE